MNKKKKITYTIEVAHNETPKSVAKKLIGKRIKMSAMMKGEIMARWARELGVSRQKVNNVVHGYTKHKYIRDFIQKRLNEIFW